ncbi:MAG: hypothetical protein PHR68_03910 [Candidatus Gracilibacteria bacterium]|nr:hypothetical protein [Candidatus Gracilibacteria bacterium]
MKKIFNSFKEKLSNFLKIKKTDKTDTEDEINNLYNISYNFINGETFFSTKTKKFEEYKLNYLYTKLINRIFRINTFFFFFFLILFGFSMDYFPYFEKIISVIFIIGLFILGLFYVILVSIKSIKFMLFFIISIILFSIILFYFKVNNIYIFFYDIVFIFFLTYVPVFFQNLVDFFKNIKIFLITIFSSFIKLFTIIFWDYYIVKIRKDLLNNYKSEIKEINIETIENEIYLNIDRMKFPGILLGLYLFVRDFILGNSLIDIIEIIKEFIEKSHNVIFEKIRNTKGFLLIYDFLISILVPLFILFILYLFIRILNSIYKIKLFKTLLEIKK